VLVNDLVFGPSLLDKPLNHFLLVECHRRLRVLDCSNVFGGPRISNSSEAICDYFLATLELELLLCVCVSELFRIDSLVSVFLGSGQPSVHVE
jgi:hypothetical protein